MMMPRAGQRLAARWHVMRHEDPLVQDYVRILIEDNKRLRETRNFVRPPAFTPSGWYVLRRVVDVAVVVAMLAAGVVWYQFTDNGQEFRRAFHLAPQDRAMRTAEHGADSRAVAPK